MSDKKTLNDAVDDAVRNVLALVRTNVKHDEALKYTQAALNLAQAKRLLLGK
tara:strand:- start:15 stop:170 length:156 start_codon:yes stop_codon:yes gene_type:complete